MEWTSSEEDSSDGLGTTFFGEIPDDQFDDVEEVQGRGVVGEWELLDRLNVSIDIEPIDAFLLEQARLEVQQALDNVLRLVPNGLDPTNNVTPSEFFDVWFDRCLLESMQTWVEKYSGQSISVRELKSFIKVELLLAFYNCSPERYYNPRYKKRYNPITDEMSLSRYREILKSLSVNDSPNDNVRKRNQNNLLRWDVPYSPNKDLEEATETFRENSAKIGFVPGVSVACIDDDLMRMRSRNVQKYGFSQIHNPKKGLGVIHHGAVSVVTGLYLCGHVQRRQESTVDAVTILQKALSRSSVERLINLTGNHLLWDRGYGGPDGVINRTSVSRGAHVSGTAKRVMSFPFTYGTQNPGPKRILVQDSGSDVMYCARKRIPGVDERIKVPQYAFGIRYSGRVTLMQTTCEKVGPGKFAFITKSGRDDSQKQERKRKMKNNYYDSFYREFEDNTIERLTMSQSTPEWFLLRKFCFTGTSAEVAWKSACNDDVIHSFVSDVLYFLGFNFDENNVVENYDLHIVVPDLNIPEDENRGFIDLNQEIIGLPPPNNDSGELNNVENVQVHTGANTGNGGGEALPIFEDTGFGIGVPVGSIGRTDSSAPTSTVGFSGNTAIAGVTGGGVDEATNTSTVGFSGNTAIAGVTGGGVDEATNTSTVGFSGNAVIAGVTGGGVDEATNTSTVGFSGNAAISGVTGGSVEEATDDSTMDTGAIETMIPRTPPRHSQLPFGSNASTPQISNSQRQRLPFNSPPSQLYNEASRYTSLLSTRSPSGRTRQQLRENEYRMENMNIDSAVSPLATDGVHTTQIDHDTAHIDDEGPPLDGVADELEANDEGPSVDGVTNELEANDAFEVLTEVPNPVFPFNKTAVRAMDKPTLKNHMSEYGLSIEGTKTACLKRMLDYMNRHAHIRNEILAANNQNTSTNANNNRNNEQPDEPAATGTTASLRLMMQKWFMGPRFTTTEMKIGKANEENVIRMLPRFMAKRTPLKVLHVEEYGLLRNRKRPELAVSPDGIMVVEIAEGFGVLALLEIKTKVSKVEALKEYALQKEFGYFQDMGSEPDTEDFHRFIPDRGHRVQLLHGMATTGCEYALYVVAATNEIIRVVKVRIDFRYLAIYTESMHYLWQKSNLDWIDTGVIPDVFTEADFKTGGLKHAVDVYTIAQTLDLHKCLIAKIAQRRMPLPEGRMIVPAIIALWNKCKGPIDVYSRFLCDSRSKHKKLSANGRVWIRMIMTCVYNAYTSYILYLSKKFLMSPQSQQTNLSSLQRTESTGQIMHDRVEQSSLDTQDNQRSNRDNEKQKRKRKR